MDPFRYHVFVCTQEKPEGVPCCTASGAQRVLDALRKEIGARGLSEEVQVTTTGCMGTCEHGPVVVAYPEGVWYSGVKPEDVPDLVGSHLGAGSVLKRLAREDTAEMKAEILEHTKKYLAMMRARDAAGTLPDDLEALVRGFMSSRAVLTALELDIFSTIADGGTAEEVAASISADTRATEMLLNALVSLKLLEKSDGQFRNTAISGRYFRAGSKDNARPGLLHTAHLWHRWSNLTETVRTGTPAPCQRDTGQTRDFIAAMERNASERAAAVVKAVGNGIRRMLDLGGGSAAYSIAFARAIPGLHSCVLDVPEVIGLTESYIQRAGLSDRIGVTGGDMLSSPLGEGHDLVLLSAICHMFSPEQNRALLKRIHAALAPGGRVVVQDFILEADKTSPRFAALFSLNMLVNTQGGASYSEPEYTAWMKEAGFATVERMRLPGPASLMIGAKS
jgi:(2Fe-2S) ferredoxin/predicted O-methyltransferase YrrM